MNISINVLNEIWGNDAWHVATFGEMMLDMLPQDLAFTVLVPSEDAFKRDLRLSVNDSFKPDKFNDTYAIVSRILGFSAVPGTLSLANVQLGELVNYDSSSGFPLYFSKDINGMLVVNRIWSEIVDVRKKEILVHVMDGVIMDAEFEESILAEDDTEEDWIYCNRVLPFDFGFIFCCIQHRHSLYYTLVHVTMHFFSFFFVS